MFNWVCPRCGRENSPSYVDCPDCKERDAQEQKSTAEMEVPAFVPPVQPPPYQPQPQYVQPPQPQQPQQPVYQSPQPQYAPQAPYPQYPQYAPQQPQYAPPQQYQQPPQYAPQQPPQYAPQPPQYAHTQTQPVYPPQPQYPPQPPYATTQPMTQPVLVGQPVSQPVAQPAAPKPAAPIQPKPITPLPPEPPSPGFWARLGALPFPVLMLLFAAVFLLLGAGAYFGYQRFGKGAAGFSGGEPAAAVAKSKAPSNPMQKYVEVVGIRLTSDAKKKPIAKFVVVNHASTELANLEANVTLWASTSHSEEDAVGSFTFHLSNLGPFDSKEESVPFKTKLKLYELPDWQNATAEVQITSPQP